MCDYPISASKAASNGGCPLAAALKKKCRRKFEIATSGETSSLFAVNRDPALSAIKRQNEEKGRLQRRADFFCLGDCQFDFDSHNRDDVTSLVVGNTIKQANHINPLLSKNGGTVVFAAAAAAADTE